jgi:hypothetical protein
MFELVGVAGPGYRDRTFISVVCCVGSVLASIAALVESIVLVKNTAHRTPEFATWCSYFLFSLICGGIWINVARLRGKFEKNSRNGKAIHREMMCSYYYTSMNLTAAFLLLLLGAKFSWNERDLSSVLSSYFCANQIFMIGAVPLFLSGCGEQDKRRKNARSAVF